MKIYYCTKCKRPWEAYMNADESDRLEGKKSLCCDDGLMTIVKPENQGQ